VVREYARVFGSASIAACQFEAKHGSNVKRSDLTMYEAKRHSLQGQCHKNAAKWLTPERISTRASISPRDV
jgi:hypothetical protein